MKATQAEQRYGVWDNFGQCWKARGLSEEKASELENNLNTWHGATREQGQRYEIKPTEDR